MFLAYLYLMRCRLLFQMLSFAVVCLLFTSISGCKRNRTYTVRSETVQIESPYQILSLPGELVKPLLYTNISGLERLPVPEAKEKFISAVLPAILVAKNEIETLRINIGGLKEKSAWNESDSSFYVETKSRYKAKDIDDLIVRIGTMPNSIVLSQAAVESGWGQSRFFLEGNNLFGIWSFNSDEPRIAAGLTRKGKTIYIRSYTDLSQSIIHYFEILGSANAYRSLRKARLDTTDPFELLPHLKYFSERRNSYTDQLKEIIIRNNLFQYDNYRIDPDYLVPN
jgi:Bax protein